jgi:hypothetical protein
MPRVGSINDDWEDQSDDFEESSPPQFSLRTLMIVVTGAAVVFSLIAWWGLFPAVAIFGIALGIFLGLLLCSYLGLCSGFNDLRWDIPKCFMVACATVGPVCILVLLNIPNFPYYIYPFIPAFCYWFTMKSAWEELELPEIFLTAVISFCTMATMVYVTSKIVGY